MYRYEYIFLVIRMSFSRVFSFDDGVGGRCAVELASSEIIITLRNEWKSRIFFRD